MAVLRAGIALVFALPIVASATSDPVDVIAYGDHVPTLTYNGAPFVNPFVDPVQDNDTPPDSTTDTPTRIGLKTVPGMAYPLGSHGWGQAAWSKYVLMAAYDEQAGGFFQQIDDQRIGVFNTETHTFCQLDVDPELTNGGVQWLTVANPTARQTRIFFSGYAVTGKPFGYIEADADNDTPCNRQTDVPPGWRVVGWTSDEINAAGPQGKTPCITVPCNFDGLGYLGHDSSTNRDTLVLNGWADGRLVVAQVDSAGSLFIPDVFQLPYWQPAGVGGQCYNRRPVALPGVDATRPEGNRRFTYAFEPGCDPVGNPPCSPDVGLCPDGTACSESSPCSQHYCQVPYFAATYFACNPDNPNNVCVQFGLGACVSCPAVAVSPGRRCSVTTGRVCRVDSQCPAGEDCVCTAPGAAAQEFKFDGSTLSTTSAMFQASASHYIVNLSSYDSFGNLWLSDMNEQFDPSTSKGPIIYLKDGNNEHKYYTTTQPAGSAIWPEDSSIPYEALTYPTYYALSARQVTAQNASMYILGKSSVQRANFGYGAWLKDSGYKRLLGTDMWPPEARRCSAASSNAGNACTTIADCPGGTCDIVNNAVYSSSPFLLSYGGAPASLWTSPRFTDPMKKHGAMDAYLVRIPVATDLPDGVSGVRPGAAWSGDRMWLVAEHDGVLKYRTRDDGFWSGWFSLPSNITVTGGAAVISNGVTVRIFARNAANSKIYETVLASPINCAAGSCVWSSAGWVLVDSQTPSAPVTDQEPAAAFQGTGSLAMVAVRRSSDGKTYFTKESVPGTWTSWQQAGSGVTTPYAPSMAWHSGQSKAWIVVSETSTGTVKYTRVPGSNPWAVVGVGSYDFHGTPPAIAFDGSRMRAFATLSAFPNYVYQAIEDGSGWGNWRQMASVWITTRQPAPVNVNGEINLFTHWFTWPIQEQALE